MSKNNNVNPGQYKVAGRERPGEGLNQNTDKQQLAKSRDAKANKGGKKRWAASPQQAAPPQCPEETKQQLACSCQLLLRRRQIGMRRKAQPQCNLHLRREFPDGSEGDPDMVDVPPVQTAALAFSDIRRDRHRSPAQLRAEAVAFLLR